MALFTAPIKAVVIVSEALPQLNGLVAWYLGERDGFSWFRTMEGFEFCWSLERTRDD